MSSSQQQQEQRLTDTMRQRIQRLEEDNRTLFDTVHSYKSKCTELERCMEQQHRDALAAIKQWQSDSYSLQQRNSELEAHVKSSQEKMSQSDEENRNLQRLIAQQTMSLTNLQDRHRTDLASLEAAQKELREVQAQLVIAEKDAFQAHKKQESREAVELQLEEDLRHSRTALHQLEAIKTRLETKLRDVELERDQWQKDCQEVLELNQSMRQELHSSSNSASVAFDKAAKSSAQLESLLAQLAGVQSQASDVQRRLESAESFIRDLQSEKQTLSEEADRLREQALMSDQSAENLLVAHESLKGELAIAQAALQQELEARKVVKQQLDVVTAENEALKKQLDDLDSDLVEHLDTIEGLKRRATALQEVVDSSEKTMSELDIRLSETTSEKEMQCFKLLEVERTLEALKEEYSAHKANAMQLSDVLMELQGTHDKLAVTAEHDAAEVLKLREMLTETRATLASEVHKGDALTEANTQLTTERDQLHDANATLQTRLTTIEATLTQTTADLAAANHTAQHTLAQVTALTASMESLTLERDHLQTQANELSHSLQTTTAELETLKGKHAELIQEMTEVDRTMQENIETFRDARAETLRESEALREELKTLKEAHDSVTNDLQTAQSDAKIRAIEYRALEEQLRELEESREAMVLKQQHHAAEKQKLSSRIADLEGARTSSLRQVAELNMELDKLRTQHKQAVFNHETALAANERTAADLRERLEAEFVRRDRAEEVVDQLQQRLQDSETEIAQLTTAKKALTSRVEELKSRCSSDAEKINLLLEKHNKVKAERDETVIKYNQIFGMLKEAKQALRKQDPNVSVLNTSIGADPFVRQNIEQQAQQAALLRSAEQQIRSLCETCEQQEKELQELREHNQVLQSSVSKFLDANTVTVEEMLHDKSITVHALNTEEGPRRVPKRRPTTHIRTMPAFPEQPSQCSEPPQTELRKRARVDIVPFGEQHVNL